MRTYPEILNFQNRFSVIGAHVGNPRNFTESIPPSVSSKSVLYIQFKSYNMFRLEQVGKKVSFCCP